MGPVLMKELLCRLRTICPKLARKKKATASFGYLMLFVILMMISILTIYLTEAGKLMTHQHEIDDALSDAVLASLVADDTYFFETRDQDGGPVLRFRDHEQSHQSYVNCMETALQGREDFYIDLEYTDYIEYEVEGKEVTITSFSAGQIWGSSRTEKVGSVTTPSGIIVENTSAYARVTFDIRNTLSGSLIEKSRDIYCTFEIDQ